LKTIRRNSWEVASYSDCLKQEHALIREITSSESSSDNSFVWHWHPYLKALQPHLRVHKCITAGQLTPVEPVTGRVHSCVAADAAEVPESSAVRRSSETFHVSVECREPVSGLTVRARHKGRNLLRCLWPSEFQPDNNYEWLRLHQILPVPVSPTKSSWVRESFWDWNSTQVSVCDTSKVMKVTSSWRSYMNRRQL